MGKKCDLCGGVARMYCESDEASLCFDCDGKVHGANFLVAKHTRCLLCTACHSFTPWKATGLRVGPTFSVCDSCVALKKSAKVCSSSNRVSTANRDRKINGLDLEEEYGDDGAESYDEDEEEDRSDEESDNQVVPWTAAAQPCVATISSSSESGSVIEKRTRDYSDEEEVGCSSCQESNYSRPLKRQSRDDTAFKSTAVVNSVIRLEGEI